MGYPVSAEFRFQPCAVEGQLLRSEHCRARLEAEDGVQGGRGVRRCQCCVHPGEAVLEQVEEIMREPGGGGTPGVFDQGLHGKGVQDR